MALRVSSTRTAAIGWYLLGTGVQVIVTELEVATGENPYAEPTTAWYVRDVGDALVTGKARDVPELPAATTVLSALRITI
jgi:hypothetical protein